MQLYYMFSMQLYIGKESRVRNIQTSFNAFYPFLKIDFLKDHGTDKQASTEKISPDARVKLVNKTGGQNKINVDGQKTLAELKKEFKELTGLKAEIFRKSGNMWIETSLTDDWTLAQQNKEGELISMHTDTS